ncbi:MAG: serine hydrolase domain-containing protein, partial [Acidobacteriota bacterium]
MRELIAFVYSFLLLQGIAFADPADAFVEGYIKKKNIPGVALLVVRNGAITKSQGYGLANVEHQVPVKPETIFQSGSVGKQFTATAVMMLVEENKLRVTDPISKFLKVPDTWKGITIRHLLTHTSGLGDYPEQFSLRKDYTEDELLAMITAQPLGFAPGEKWNYSNLGYVTLGILIRKVTGQYYGDFLRDRVFHPIGMKDARIINESDLVSNRAAGYTRVKGKLKNQDWVSPSLNS